MAVALLDNDTKVLLDTLSQLPTPQLAIAVTQHASLSDHIANALRRLAAISISNPFTTVDEDILQQSHKIANIIRKLITRGDPSLVRKLLPNQSSLIDLALCTNAKDLMSRLVDETEASNYIRAASLAFERAVKAEMGSKEDQIIRMAKAARVLACLVSVMPGRKVVEEKLTKGQREHGSEESQVIRNTISSLQVAYDALKQSDVLLQMPLLEAKISMLDAAWYLVERFLAFVSKSTKRSPVKEVDDLLDALCGSSESTTLGSTPLVNMTMAVDLSIIRPLRNCVKADVRQYSSVRLESVYNQAKQAGFTVGEAQQLIVLGPAWSQVVSSVERSAPKEQVESSLVESVLAVLPYLDRADLQMRLSNSRYAGKDAETVIQLLLEEDDGDLGGQGQVGSIEVEAFEDVEALRILQDRANIFDSHELEGVKVTRGKSKQEEISSGLSEDIRAAILARAEEPDSDGDEEWNPFSEAAFEVGFEEEMEEEEEDNVREKGMAGVADRNPANDDVDEEDEEDEEEEHHENDEAGRGGASGPNNNVASERAAERLLISVWSERGEAIFSKEARKSAIRTELKGKLNELPGRRWDDALIESWATMFARNPRKDKLLASVDDIMRLGNQNLAGTSASPNENNWGPDKGKGGRIFTGERGARGGGRGGRGRGRGGRGGRGSSRGARGGGGGKGG